MSPDINDARKIIERLHNCKASFIENIAVIEKFGDKTVCQGIVHVFRIEGHPKADKCYAWASPLAGSTKKRYYAVLHTLP